MAKEKKQEFVQHITPRDENFSQWYTDVVTQTDLMDYTPVRGCMALKPYGNRIWELIREGLDRRFQETGHENVSMPMLIPESLLLKEADHVEGFAPEVAWVTQGGTEKLQERLAVRPTSETIFCTMFSKWVQSYRDLPLKYNQWCSVMRWEKTTRPFLRTAEFWWQEGHTVHATAEEAEEETQMMLNVYKTFCEKNLAIPVFAGQKSDKEKFAGARATYSVEAMMQDGKALQAGTSHFLGQNFAKAFEVQFLNKENKLEYVWATSWGVSTRLMGALIMTHSDDNGLVLPPRLAPIHVAIVPICKSDEQQRQLDEHIAPIVKALEAKGLVVKYDNRPEYKPGWKFTEYEFKGVPVQLAIGARDMENGTCEVRRRDTLEKITMPIEGIADHVYDLMEQIQQNLFKKAADFRASMTRKVDTWEDFKVEIEKNGFLLCHWDGTPETEERIKEETKATIRCIPYDAPEEEGKCIYSGKPSHRRVVFARSY